MYGNLKYEQRQAGHLGERELPSLLSWRQGINNGIAPMDRQQRYPSPHNDVGNRFDDDRTITHNRLPESRDFGGHSNESIEWTCNPDAVNSGNQDNDARQPAGLSWRERQSGSNNTHPSDPFPLMPPRASDNDHSSDPMPLMSSKGTNGDRTQGPLYSSLNAGDRYSDTNEGGGRSWRPSQTQLGTNNSPPSLMSLQDTNNSRPSDPPPRIPPVDDRYRDVNEPAGLSWRSSQPLMGSNINNTRPNESSPLKSPREERYRDEPAGLGYRPSQPPLGERYRDEPAGLGYRSSQPPLGTMDTRPSEPPPRSPSAADERYRNIDKPSTLSWRSSQPSLGTNDTRPAGPSPLMPPRGTNDANSSEPPSRIPAAEERYKDISEPTALSWRSSQPPLGNNDTRPSGPTPLMPPREERYKDVNEPAGLSWRSSQPPLGSNDTRPSGPTPLMPPRDTNDTRPSEPTSADERCKDIGEPSTLSWRSSQPPLGTNDTRPSGPTPLMPPREERDTKEPTALSWRATQSDERLQDKREPSTLNWRTIQAEERASEPVALSWRTAQSGSSNARLPEPTPLMSPIENRFNDKKEPVALSWRSTQSGAQGSRPPGQFQPSDTSGAGCDDMKRPLSWRDAPIGGDLLGKRRYSDMFPDDSSRLPARDPYVDRPSYPAKAFY